MYAHRNCRVVEAENNFNINKRVFYIPWKPPMGNFQSVLCQSEPQDITTDVFRVKDPLSEHSADFPGADASDDGDKIDASTPQSTVIAANPTDPYTDHQQQNEAQEQNEAQGQEESQDKQQQEQEEEGKRTIKLTTAPIDPRFTSTNASRQCFVAYNEYHKCIKQQGEDNPECLRYAKVYRSICPLEWIANWNEQRENGKWFGKY